MWYFVDANLIAIGSNHDRRPFVQHFPVLPRPYAASHHDQGPDEHIDCSITLYTRCMYLAAVEALPLDTKARPAVIYLRCEHCTSSIVEFDVASAAYFSSRLVKGADIDN